MQCRDVEGLEAVAGLAAVVMSFRASSGESGCISGLPGLGALTLPAGDVARDEGVVSGVLEGLVEGYVDVVYGAGREAAI